MANTITNNEKLFSIAYTALSMVNEDDFETSPAGDMAKQWLAEALGTVKAIAMVTIEKPKGTSKVKRKKRKKRKK